MLFTKITTLEEKLVEERIATAKIVGIGKFLAVAAPLTGTVVGIVVGVIIKFM